MAQAIAAGRGIARRAKDLYESCLRAQVETEENIGKIILIDVETGNYEIDTDGMAASRHLRERYPDIQPESLFAIRIGYNAVYTIGGALVRTTR